MTTSTQTRGKRARKTVIGRGSVHLSTSPTSGTVKTQLLVLAVAACWFNRAPAGVRIAYQSGLARDPKTFDVAGRHSTWREDIRRGGNFRGA